jgi:hypothetical protein
MVMIFIVGKITRVNGMIKQALMGMPESPTSARRDNPWPGIQIHR